MGDSYPFIGGCCMLLAIAVWKWFSEIIRKSFRNQKSSFRVACSSNRFAWMIFSRIVCRLLSAHFLSFVYHIDGSIWYLCGWVFGGWVSLKSILSHHIFQKSLPSRTTIITWNHFGISINHAFMYIEIILECSRHCSSLFPTRAHNWNWIKCNIE